jgi:sigma-B regulation protein RsbQ
MSILARNNVHVTGRGDQPMVFAHGFGCDQNMWRFVAPEFENDFKVVLFDHVGAGGSDLTKPSIRRYTATLTTWSKSGATWA